MENFIDADEPVLGHLRTNDMMMYSFHVKTDEQAEGSFEAAPASEGGEGVLHCQAAALTLQ